MFYVIFYDRKNERSKRELCISQKEFSSLDEARKYAKTVSPSREPRVVETLSFEPQPSAH
jgi:hypothetical protein